MLNYAETIETLATLYLARDFEALAAEIERLETMHGRDVAAWLISGADTLGASKIREMRAAREVIEA